MNTLPTSPVAAGAKDLAEPSPGIAYTTLNHRGTDYRMVDLQVTWGPRLRRWPVVLRVLAENIARRASPEDLPGMVQAMLDWQENAHSDAEISFSPDRLLMHDTISTPALVDIAAMRDRLAAQGVNPGDLHPLLPVEVSVDHSLAVDSFARSDAPQKNMGEEIRRNRERYRFLGFLR